MDAAMKVVELKQEMDIRFVDLKQEMDIRFVDLKREMDTRFVELKGDVDARFDALESRFTSEHETTRLHMDVLIEQVKAEYRLGLEKMTAIEQRLASLTAVNASEHTVFTAVLQNHELRISALETKDEP